MNNTVEFKIKIKENIGRVSEKLGVSLSKLGRQTKSLEKTGGKAFSNIRDKAEGSNGAAKKTAGLIEGLEKQLGDLQKKRKGLLDPKEIAKSNREIAKLKKQLGDIDGLGLEKSGLDKLKGSLMDALPGGGMLKSPVAAIGAGVAAIGTLAYKAGQHLFSVSAAAKQSQASVRSQFGLTGQALVNTTAKFGAMSKVLKVDQKELQDSANAFFQEYKAKGATLTGTLDLIKKGIQATGGAFDLDNIKEYSAQMNQLGMTQEQTVALMVKSYKGGFYMDKPIDALKEAGLSIREMDKAQQEALAGIGINYKKLMSGLNSGKLTGIDVVKQIAAKMGETKDVAKRQKVIADIFKGAGEDAGARFFKEVLSGKLEMKGLLDATDPLIKSQERRLQLETEISKKVQGFAPAFNSVREKVDVLTLKAKSFAYGIVEKTVGWLRDNKKTLKEITGHITDRLRPAWTVVKLAVAGVWFSVKRTFNGIWKGVQLVNSAFIGLKKLTGWVMGKIGQSIDWLYNKMGGEGSLMEKLFGGTDSLWTRIKGFFEKLAGKFKAITGLAHNAFEVVNNALRGNFGKAKEGWEKLKLDFKNEWSAPSPPQKSGAKKTPTKLTAPFQPTSPKAPISPVSTELAKGSEGINGGGARQTNITVNLGKFMDSLTIQKESFAEGVDEMEQKVKETLLRVLNSANQIAAQ